MSSLHWFTSPTGPHIHSKCRYTHSCCICGAESCTAWGLSVQHTSVCMRTRPAISSSTQTQHINTHKACFRGKWASFSLHCAVSVWSPAGSWAFLYESWWTESEKQKENNNLLSSRSARKKSTTCERKKKTAFVFEEICSCRHLSSSLWHRCDLASWEKKVSDGLRCLRWL